jgi:hypothetical protein
LVKSLEVSPVTDSLKVSVHEIGSVSVGELGNAVQAAVGAVGPPPSVKVAVMMKLTTSSKLVSDCTSVSAATTRFNVQVGPEQTAALGPVHATDPGAAVSTVASV